MTVPVVSITTEPKVFIEGEGNRGSFVLTLSEPAPEGGLTLNLGTFEEDGAAGDDTIELENIDSFTLNALGLTSSVTISEGATEARLTAVSLGDDLPEDDESTTIFLIETPEYQVDPRASEATLIETDVPIVSLSVEAPTIDENGVGIFPEGAGNSASFVFNLSEPAPAGGLILNLATFEQDGAAGDDTLETENIDSFTENALGLPSSITISEGATEARLTLVSLGDDIPEGPEETTIFLIDAVGYTADPDASEATLIETDVVQTEQVSDITYDLSWEGENGYTVQGLFSFSSELKGSLITGDNLIDMQLTFFEPDGTPLQEFDYDFPNPDTSGEFNFNFDSATDTVLQSGESDSDEGFDLGIDFAAGETGTSFFTGDDDAPGFPAGIIALGDTNTPFSTDPLDQGGELIASLAESVDVI